MSNEAVYRTAPATPGLLMSLHNRTPHEHSTIKKTSTGWWPKPRGELPPVVTVSKHEIDVTDKPATADGLNP